MHFLSFCKIVNSSNSSNFWQVYQMDILHLDIPIQTSQTSQMWSVATWHVSSSNNKRNWKRQLASEHTVCLRII